jgi:hypothetical protein
MQATDDAHLSTWLTCVGAEQLDAALSTPKNTHLAVAMDLPPHFGGVGLQTLIRAAGEELLGSWAAVTSDLINFCRSKGLSTYSQIADALDSIANTPPTHMEEVHTALLHPSIDTMMTVSMRAHAFLGTIPKEEVDFSTSRIMGERTEENPGRFSPLEAPTRPDVIVLPNLRTPADYAMAPCKHECAIILKQSRHVRQAHAV